MSASGHTYRWNGGFACGMTDAGVVRHANEDNFLIDEELGLLMVGDGMGGHADGAMASEEAIAAVREHLLMALGGLPYDNRPVTAGFDPDETWPDATMPAISVLFEAVDSANRRVYERNRARDYPDGSGMGTTLTGIWHLAPAPTLLAFHVGDSRLYQLRDGELRQLTRDHTLHQVAIDSGLVDNLPKRNMLTQAIGPNPTIMPDVHSCPTMPGDLFLLCSDGVHGVVTDAELEALLRGAEGGDLGRTCALILQLAIDKGSADNATVVLSQLD